MAVFPSVSDIPHRPAAAYEIVASLLPDEYFSMAPPARGVRLSIIGRDGVSTQWDMSDTLADALAGCLSRRQTEARITRREKYVDR